MIDDNEVGLKEKPRGLGGGGGGGVKSQPGGAYNRVFNFGSPPCPKEAVLKMYWPKRADNLLLPWSDFVIMVPRSRQQGANCPLCPWKKQDKFKDIFINILVY